VMATFPVVLHLNDRAIGSLNHPGLKGELFFERNILYNVQKGNFLRWFVTDLVRYPCGQDIGLRVANSLHLFFSLPLTSLLGPISAYNILVIITLALNGLAMYFLAKDFFQSRLISFCSGLYFMLNSYVLLKINMGFLQKISLFWLPVYFLCLFRLLNKKRNFYLFGSAIFLFLVKLSYPPYAYYALIFTLAFLCYDLINTGGKLFFLKRVFWIIFLFMTFVFLFDFYIAGSRILSSQYISFQKFFYYLTPPLMPYGQVDIFHPFRFMLPFPTNLPFGISIVGVFLGIYAALLKKGLPRFFLVAIIGCFIISAGPYLMVNGEPLIIFNHRIVLPYYFLYKYTPVIYGEGPGLPLRILSIFNLCLALLIGYALTIISKKIPKKGVFVAAFLFISVFFFENLILFSELFPVRNSNLKIPEFYRKIRDEKFKAILNLPISGRRDITNLYCYYAVIADKKIMNAYDNDSLCIDLPSFSEGINVKRQFINQLAMWDVRYIVIHQGLMMDAAPLWLADFCGSPVNYEDDKLLVYKIPKNEP
jgi:hypothetical protein